MEKYEELLDEFVDEERAKSRMGSGDDMVYEQQIIDYVDKQRKLWIEFIKFIEKKVILEELEKVLFTKKGNPRCSICGKPMKQAYDSIAKKKTKYNWMCECSPNLRLSIC